MRQRASEAPRQVRVPVPPPPGDSVREALRGSRAQVHQGRLPEAQGRAGVRALQAAGEDRLLRAGRAPDMHRHAGGVQAGERPRPPVCRGGVRRSDVGPAPVQVHVRLLPPLVPAQCAFGSSRW